MVNRKNILRKDKVNKLCTYVECIFVHALRMLQNMLVVGGSLGCRRGHYWTPILRCRAINYINNTEFYNILSVVDGQAKRLAAASLDRIMQMTSFKPCLSE